MGSSHRERSQGRAEMRGREVACLPSLMGLHLGRSRGRVTPLLTKSVLSAYFETVRVVAYAVSDVPTTPVLHAITPDTRKTHLTDEVQRCPLTSGSRVRLAYKSHTKGSADAPVTGTGSPRPRLCGLRQRRSRGPSSQKVSERQNLRVPSGSLWSTGQVSLIPKATEWPGQTSSGQRIISLSNGLIQPKPIRKAVRSR